MGKSALSHFYAIFVFKYKHVDLKGTIHIYLQTVPKDI